MDIEIQPTKPVKRHSGDENQCCNREASEKSCNGSAGSSSNKTNSDTVQWAKHRDHNTPLQHQRLSKSSPVKPAFPIGVICLALLASACTVFSVEDGTNAPPTASTSTSATQISTTSTSQPPPTTTSIVSLGDPKAIVSPSGVAVAVIQTLTDGHLITTPCGNEATLFGGTPVYTVAVVLDPGHGGPIDTGAVGANGTPERDINLRVARAAEAMLLELGIPTLLTRTDDYATPLSVRADLADAVEASLMVSIHHNAPTQRPSEVPGTEVFIQSFSDESRRLGGLLYAHVMANLGTLDASWSSARDAGVMTVLNTRGDDAYGMIRRPSTPTALIELGYVSNLSESQLFDTPLYPQVAAQGITEAIVKYLETDDPGSGFVDGRTFNPRSGVGADVCVEVDLG